MKSYVGCVVWCLCVPAYIIRLDADCASLTGSNLLQMKVEAGQIDHLEGFCDPIEKLERSKTVVAYLQANSFYVEQR